MRFLGACVGIGVAVVAGCHTGGTLTGAGGAGTLSGIGGRASSGSGGGTSVVLGIGGGGPATGTGGSPWDFCGQTPPPAQRLPSRIVIVLDTSASMNDAPDGSCTGGCGSGSKWSVAVGGIVSVAGADGVPVEWGLKFIGLGGDTCETGPIDVATAPRNGDAVLAAVRARTSAAQLALPGNTPTRLAIRAATAHLLSATSPATTAMVLMTDGLPDCGTGASDPHLPDTASTVQTIQVATNSGIPTFVLGIGALDFGTGDALATMAAAGGTARSAPGYYPVASAAEVIGALNEVIRAIGDCTFAIPPPPTSDGTTSREDISVAGDGTSIPQDANDGWTYTDNTHTSVTLHGTSCDAVRARTISQVFIVFRCPIDL